MHYGNKYSYEKNIIIILPLFKFYLLLLGILKLQAAIQLPAIFSNHMVLQRNSELTFWGWGIPGETISIAPEWMKGEIIKTQVNNTGKWSARVPSGEAADLMRFVSAARQK